MSYLYDSLRDALGGKNFKTGVVTKNWSPNEVRAIYIMRNFIMVVDYLKQPKVVMLDPNEVSNDVTNSTRRGSLNNLLDNRQLSCMEEIYVDSALKPFKNVLDLEAYIKSLYNQSSRLRYYGYVSGLNLDSLRNAYSKVLVDGIMDYTLANSGLRLPICATNNKDWYKKYNLRPQFYALDGEKGRLHTYFSKCEATIGEILSKKDIQIQKLKNAEKVLTMFKTDLSRAEDLMQLTKFVSLFKDCDDFVKGIAECLNESLKKQIVIKGLTKEFLIDCLKVGNIKKDNKCNMLLEIYRLNKVFDNSEEGFDPSEDIISDGILQLGNRLDSGLAKANTKYCKSEYMILYLMASSRIPEGLPKGKLTDVLMKKNLLACEVTSKDNFSGILRYVYSLCGFEKDDIANRFKNS